MKTGAILIMTMTLASTANAWPWFVVNGVFDPPDEIWIEPGQTISIGIFGDGVTSSGQEFYLELTGPAGYDLSGVACLWNPNGCGPRTLEYEDLLYLDLAKPVVPIPRLPKELLVDGIRIHCQGEGDVTFTMSDGTFTVMDSLTIHQGDRPLPLEIIQPNGGEYYRGGTWQEIRFTDYRTPGTYSPRYQKKLSVDNGQTWMHWIGGRPDCQAGECTWQWRIPRIEGDQHLIQVFDANDPAASDTSDEPFVIYAGELYVNAENGNDTNSGISPEKAFATIQKAIDTASDGDIITVFPGTYPEHINFLGKNIVLTSTDPADPSTVRSTVISDYITFRGTEDATCTLRGFNIKREINGFDWLIDPAGQNHTHATISHCIFENFGTGCGEVIYACDGVISNCIFADIFYMCAIVPPVPQIVSCHGLIENCTMSNMGNLIKISPGGTTTLRNCILHDSAWFEVPSGATLNISYCNVEYDPSAIIGDGTINWGPGNFEADPCFADAASDDYHLKSQAGRFDPNTQGWVIDDVTSPCIDAGDPMTAIMHEPFPNGGIVNIGAYGGTAEASKSYFGKPPCENIVAGDVNGDCVVDFRDASIIFSHWLEDNAP